METKAKIINELTFNITQPYVEGHVMTEAEARALNQTRSENIGNNVRAKIKEMQAENAATADIEAFVVAKDAEYVFTLAGVNASRKLDPIEREAEKIARELLKAHLAKDGRKLTVAPAGKTEDEWKAVIDAEVERIMTSEKVVAAAKKAVEAKKKTAESLLEALGGIQA